MNTTDKTYWVWIYIAGDVREIKNICHEYCEVGLCVTVEPLDFVYTGGEQSGARIGLINYPRFPSPKENIWTHAMELAGMLHSRLFQDSVLIMDADNTTWITRQK